MSAEYEFTARMKRILGDEYEKYAAAREQPPCRAFHVNLGRKGWTELRAKTDIFGEKISFSDNGYLYAGGDGVGFTPAHHSGLIYMQEPSAMLPVSSYDFSDAKYVLDLCAAPGGKSSQIACSLNDGVLFSNEIVPERAAVLARNIERMGYRNVVVTRNLPEDYARNLPCFFDVVLVDAPCSGEGMMRKEPEAVSQWSETLVESCALRQKQILDCAHKTLKSGGILIYSTCTFSPEENEDVISYLTSRYGYIPISASDAAVACTRSGLEERCKGFDSSCIRRFYPFLGLGEGQTFCALKKTTDCETPVRRMKLLKQKNDKIARNFISEFTLLEYSETVYDGKYFILPAFGYDTGLNVIFDGVRLGESDGKRFIPHHHFFSALPEKFRVVRALDGNDAMNYLKGEETDIDVSGWGAYTYLGAGLGGFKASGGKAKNHYPKGLRNPV